MQLVGLYRCLGELLLHGVVYSRLIGFSASRRG